MSVAMIDESQLFINGEWRDSHSGSTALLNAPADGQLLGSVSFGDAEDVDCAVRAAAQAFPGWASTNWAYRQAKLAAIALHLETRQDELGQRIALSNGKPLAEAKADVADAVACYRYYSRLDAMDVAKTVAELPVGLTARKQYIPLGVAALLVPWNFPLVTSAWKVAPALLAGCTVVLKVSELTPFAELALGTAAQYADVPSGVLNIITGGPECGAALTSHALIDKISFTGSNAVGRSVMEAAAVRTVPVTLELGGKSAIIVFPDSDLDEAADIVAAGIFTNSGQVCSATSRLLVHGDVAAELKSKLLNVAARIELGDPLSPSTTMGCMTSRQQFEKVRAYLSHAKEEGIEILTGGTTTLVTQFGILPTIYCDVPTTSRLWLEEVFGPVLSMRSFQDQDEALRMANATSFGLGAVVLTADLQCGERIATRLRAGNVWVNAPQPVFPGGSWGGFGASGFGRELGPEGVIAFMGLRQIVQLAR